MKQYIELLKTIQEKGTYKPAARANMPGTQSLFGYQFRHNLADGFPLLTTKKISFKNVVTELLWFLRGDTNIKYLVDNGCNIWNEDAYNYYLKQCKLNDYSHPMGFEAFVSNIKNGPQERVKESFLGKGYYLGDCGFQYGRVWREWGEKNIPSGVLKITETNFTPAQKAEFMQEWDKACRSSKPVIVQDSRFEIQTLTRRIDQIQTLIEGLKNNPESRRHIVTAIDPAHDQDLALYWCHAIFQFNCRPLTHEEKVQWVMRNTDVEMENLHIYEETLKPSTPKYYLDCQLYQRSADSFLGVPFNIASYALLTHIIAKICNMIPGEFIHSFGDLHIYDNHREQVAEQLIREPKELPTLKLGENVDWKQDIDIILTSIDLLPKEARSNFFALENYNPEPAIKAELSTGLIKQK